ncbi:D-arabinono-1,4-lactone oxidase [Aeoliella sp. SH292]|uniref:D-arabinono-1,4-lactone oxidase n=1 Tax=Aeoliella sp. SH292 TaxID=3454464 RepID=UPI003F9E5D06
MRIRNFGRNLDFTPDQYFAPQSASEVLDVLVRVKGKRVRTIGALHSWSEAPLEDEVVLSTEYLDGFRVEKRGTETWVLLGGGCRLKDILPKLDAHWLTLPTLGLITEQSIAGAAATGTHGSGRQSVSHFVDEVTLAHYDPATGEPTLTTVRDPALLRSARCSLGCMGVVVEVGIRCREQYRVEEHFSLYDDLTSVRDAEREFPLQQFFLIPYAWKYLAQHRRETPAPRSRLAWLYRWYWFVCMDVGLHLVILSLVRVLRSPRLARWFFRNVAITTAIRNWRVVDKSQSMLTMEHELFRHIEIEMFVPSDRLGEMLDFTQSLLLHAAGVQEIEARWQQPIAELGLADALQSIHGVYGHHYPICIRKVLADDTAISMSSGDDTYYAVSFISYEAPERREGFFQFAAVLAHATGELVAARPHWGKVCPIDSAEVVRLYPNLAEFRAACEQFDPLGAFRNPWLAKVLFEE